MRKHKWFAGIALALVPGMAVAQVNNCADRDMVTERLKTGYGEEFAGGGLRDAESIFEVWYSEDKGTWTILMTKPDGSSCIMASGTDWRVSVPGKQPAGIPG